MIRRVVGELSFGTAGRHDVPQIHNKSPVQNDL